MPLRLHNELTSPDTELEHIPHSVDETIAGEKDQEAMTSFIEVHGRSAQLGQHQRLIEPQIATDDKPSTSHARFKHPHLGPSSHFQSRTVSTATREQLEEMATDNPEIQLMVDFIDTADRSIIR